VWRKVWKVTPSSPTLLAADLILRLTSPIRSPISLFRTRRTWKNTQGVDGQYSERTLALRINTARALQETTMTLITLLLILARPEFRKLMREELKANPGERAN